jgi:hypothetical protein
MTVLQAVIHGDFDMYDYYEALPSGLDFTPIADRTFIMVDIAKLDCGQDSCEFQVPSVTDYANLSPNDPLAKFGEQPTLGFCSAFLAGSSTGETDAADLVVTAGVCANALELSEIAFVLGWHTADANDHGSGPIPISDIYQAVEARVIVDDSPDNYAVLKLDRPVAKSPLTLADSTTNLPPHLNITCVGYSVGAPVKIHTHAKIIELYDKFFTANLDTYAGIAGAPVVNDYTNEVIGILVRGDTDFVPCEPWHCSNEHPDDYDWYYVIFEEANRIDPVLAYLGPDPTAEELLAELVNGIELLDLKPGILNSLMAKLASVTKALENEGHDKDKVAINNLKAFINEVEAQSGKSISQEVANDLISTAQQIVDSVLSA